MVGYILAVVDFPCSKLWLKSQLATGLIGAIKPALDTPHEKSTEVCIPVLEQGRQHVGSGCASVLKIMIKIAFSYVPN